MTDKYFKACTPATMYVPIEYFLRDSNFRILKKFQLKSLQKNMDASEYPITYGQLTVLG